MSKIYIEQRDFAELMNLVVRIPYGQAVPIVEKLKEIVTKEETDMETIDTPKEAYEPMKKAYKYLMVGLVEQANVPKPEVEALIKAVAESEGATAEEKAMAFIKGGGNLTKKPGLPVFTKYGREYIEYYVQFGDLLSRKR